MVTADANEVAALGEYGTARERRGWYFYDWANSAFQTTVVVAFLGPHLTSVAKAAAVDGYVHPFGLDVPTLS